MDLNFLGIGPLELVLVFVLLLILFGPNDLARMARELGRWVNKIRRSENFQVIQQASQEIRRIPERIVREAELDEVTQDLQTIRDEATRDVNQIKQETQEAGLPNNPLAAWTQDLSTPARAAGANEPASAPAASTPEQPKS
jgi:sec-independent protein translocase protein TatB